MGKGWEGQCCDTIVWFDQWLSNKVMVDKDGDRQRIIDILKS
jgi:hypothetical protein